MIRHNKISKFFFQIDITEIKILILLMLRHNKIIYFPLLIKCPMLLMLRHNKIIKFFIQIDII